MSARCALAFALAAWCGLGCHPVRWDGADGGPSTPQPEAAPQIRLVVLLVVDQLASWTFERDRQVLDGGLRRIIDEGVYYPHAEFPYATTYTAPGHAALGTGAPPRVTGILGNRWYRRSEGKERSAIDDPDAHTLCVGGRTVPVGQGVSPHELQVDGLADVLRAHGGGRSIAIGLKSRAANLMLGRRADLAVWLEPDLEAFATSSWYTESPPPWLEALDREHPVSEHYDYCWTPSDPAILDKLGLGPDRDDGEGGDEGLGIEFPHCPGKSARPARALRLTPAGDHLVLQAAKAAIAGERLGADEHPDLLGLTFSAHDYAGHLWGQRSWERTDLLLQLDHTIGELLDHLDKTVGREHYAVVLSSDHGATPLIERSRAAGHDAYRVRVADIEAKAKAAATHILGPGTWIAQSSASTIYVTPAFKALDQGKKDRALDAIVDAIRPIPGVGFVDRHDRLSPPCDRHDGISALACRSLHPKLSGAVFFTPARYSLITTHYTTGTSHGSATEEDRVVPVAIFAPGLTPAHHDTRINVLRVATTVAALLGIPAPPAAVPGSLIP